MKTINSFLFALALSVLLCNCKSKNSEQNSDLKIINVDVDKCDYNFDMAEITDSTVLIIPLETSPESLISNIDKLEIKNERIYVMDKLAQSIFIYDMQGKYINKISYMGQGPGEYSNISDITVTDSTIIVVDIYTSKLIEYGLPSLKFIWEEQIVNELSFSQILALPGCMYYINEWRNSKLGKYRLFSKKSGSDHYGTHLPFKEEPFCIGLKGMKYAINQRAASIIYRGDDCIYRINEAGDVYPEYEVKFSAKKVVYTSGKIENVEKDNPPGRVIGISSINESDKYLFFNIEMTGDGTKPTGLGNDDYTCIYNKSSGETIVYPQVAIHSKLNKEMLHVHRIIDNKIIFWWDNASVLLSIHMDNSHKITNKEYQTQLKGVLNRLKEDDNPVLFIYNIK